MTANCLQPLQKSTDFTIVNFPTSSAGVFFSIILTMIVLSIFTQLIVGACLIYISRYNVNDEQQLRRAAKVNNFITLAITVVVVLNVFISAFGVETMALRIVQNNVIVDGE